MPMPQALLLQPGSTGEVHPAPLYLLAAAQARSARYAAELVASRVAQQLLAASASLESPAPEEVSVLAGRI